mmetsp:Transcript_44669/g.74423  ORF Transcript_44669/g.74423 Transcript_44669/m.74423 type:complete len:207 (+) Transcript_44669:397-1017(+)
MTNSLGPHKRQQDVIVLLALVAIDGGDTVGVAKERVGGATGLEDVTDEVFLAVVGREDRDGLARIAQQTHKLVNQNHILSLGHVLEKVGSRLAFSLAMEVADIDELHDVGKACIGLEELRRLGDVREVLEEGISPSVEISDFLTGTALFLEVLDVDTKTDESAKQRLGHAAVSLERLVLDDGRELVVVADEHETTKLRSEEGLGSR